MLESMNKAAQGTIQSGFPMPGQQLMAKPIKPCLVGLHLDHLNSAETFAISWLFGDFIDLQQATRMSTLKTRIGVIQECVGI